MTPSRFFSTHRPSWICKRLLQAITEGWSHISAPTLRKTSRSGTLQSISHIPVFPLVGDAGTSQLCILTTPQSSKGNPATIGTLDQRDAIHRGRFLTAPRRKLGAEGVRCRLRTSGGRPSDCFLGLVRGQGERANPLAGMRLSWRSGWECMGSNVDFETGMAPFRGGERARSFESLIMSLRIWDGGCQDFEIWFLPELGTGGPSCIRSLAEPDLCSARGIFYLS